MLPVNMVSESTQLLDQAPTDEAEVAALRIPSVVAKRHRYGAKWVLHVDGRVGEGDVLLEMAFCEEGALAGFVGACVGGIAVVVPVIGVDEWKVECSFVVTGLEARG
jgi:hypothetical protein